MPRFRALPLVCLCCLLILGGGCLAFPFQARVDAFLRQGSAGELAPGGSLFIDPDPRAANPILESQVAGKLSHLLRRAHYQVGPGGRHRLAFTYDTRRFQRSDFQWRQEPDQYVSVREKVDGQYQYRTVRVPGRSHQEPVLVTAWENRFTLKAWRGKTLVWVGEIKAESNREDLRGVLDYLIIAAVDSLGKDSGRAREVSVSRDDPRLAELAALYGGQAK